MTTPLFIFGTGGHAREVADIADAIGRRPIFVTHDDNQIAQWEGTDDIIHEVEAAGRSSEAFAIGIGDNTLRATVAIRYWNILRFSSVAHPESSFGRKQRETFEATSGSVVFAGARLSSGIQLGNFCVFNSNSSVSHDCAIGDFVTIAPGASVAGNVRIGRAAWIGIGAAINQGTDMRKLEIGDDTMIGSGAVVLADCDSRSVYAGVPARKIRE
jgi:sugar O-acyltransferase (sialic acid O-acetyltransferase NeuD family)